MTLLSQFGNKNRKMKHKVIEPEVIVGLGNRTVFKTDKKNAARIIDELHIDIEDWLGDDLVTCHPVFLVSSKLKDYLQEEQLAKNINFTKFELTFSEYFDDNYKLDKEIPDFFWLKFSSNSNTNPLFIDSSYNLNIEENLLFSLKSTFSLNFLEIEPQRDELDDIIDQMILESKNKND